MTNLLHGLTALGSLQAVLYLLLGAVIGVVVGAIPGLSTAVVLSLILVFVYHVDLTGTLCLFLGTHAGSYYSASVSSILLNSPPHPEAVPLTLDGYPMAKRGEPGRALGLSACSTFAGGLIGCVVFVGFIQLMNTLPKVLHPPDYVAVITLAIVLVGVLSGESAAKALVSSGAGLVLASVGPSNITGIYRFTFGSSGLNAGISLVALALGIFVIPQMVMIFGTGTPMARQDIMGRRFEISRVEDSPNTPASSAYRRQMTAGVLEAIRRWPILLQSGIVGALSGMIPGIGGFTGNYLAYGIARQTSRKRDQYGTGIADGIIAPEGSSLAKEAGHMIPILALGIPGGIGGALFIGALAIQNIKTGYGFTQAYPVIPYEIAWILLLSGLIGTLIGLGAGPKIARIANVPGPLLVPVIFVLCAAGSFLVDTQFFSVVEVIVFGLMGFALRRLGYPLASFILALVLGPTLETNVYLTRNLYPGVSFLADRPSADVLFALAGLVLLSKVRETRRAKARRAAASAGTPDDLEPGDASRQPQQATSFPLLAVVTSGVLLGGSLWAGLYAATTYHFTTATIPVIGAALVFVPCMWLFPRDLAGYVGYRRARRARRRRERESMPAGSALQPRKTPTVPEEPEEPEEPGDRAAPPGPRLIPVEKPAESALRTREAPPVLKGSEDRAAPLARRFISIENSWAKNGQYRREVIGFAWFAGVIALCWLVGFVWGSGIFLVVYGLTSTRRYLTTWKSRALFIFLSCGLTCLAVYEMFALTYLTYTPVINL
jgi:putative tricarboxylic transport membrane protein